LPKDTADLDGPKHAKEQSVISGDCAMRADFGTFPAMRCP
jgi:hypothetical protein